MTIACWNCLHSQWNGFVYICSLLKKPTEEGHCEEHVPTWPTQPSK